MATSPVQFPELQVVGGIVMGWVVKKFALAPKTVPMWATWAGMTLAGVLVYIYITPDFDSIFRNNWRVAIAGLISFVFQVRGSAGASSDSGIAPPTNSQ